MYYIYRDPCPISGGYYISVSDVPESEFDTLADKSETLGMAEQIVEWFETNGRYKK